jgi:hypothetical protein
MTKDWRYMVNPDKDSHGYHPMRKDCLKSAKKAELIKIMDRAANNVMFGIDYGESNTSSYSFMIS